MKTKSIIVIKTKILGRDNYIAHSGISKRTDGNYAVDYTTNPHIAKEFESEGKAEEFIPKIVNPFDRQLQVDTVQVDAEKRSFHLRVLPEEVLK